MTSKRGFTFMEVLICLVILGLLAAIAIPAFKDAKNHVRLMQPGNSTNWLSPRTEYKAPTFNITKHKPSGPDIDPATIQPQNNGYLIDLDGDGINDKLMLDDTGKVTWSKGKSNGTFYYPVVILTITGQSLMAYTVLTRAGDTKPSVLFWTSGDRKGYHATMLRLTETGYPYFGGIEEGE